MRTKAKPTSSLISSTEENMETEETKPAELLATKLPHHLFNMSSALLKESLVSRAADKHSPVLDFSNAVMMPPVEDDSSDSPDMISTGASIDSEEMEEEEEEEEDDEDDDDEEEEEVEEYEDEAELMRLAFVAATSNRMTASALQPQSLASKNNCSSEHSTTFMPYGLSTCLTSEFQNVTIPAPLVPTSSSLPLALPDKTLVGHEVEEELHSTGMSRNDLQSKLTVSQSSNGFGMKSLYDSSVSKSMAAQVSQALTTPNLPNTLSNSSVLNTLSYMHNEFSNNLTKNPFNELPVSLRDTLLSKTAQTNLLNTTLPNGITSDYSSAFLNALPDSLLNRNLTSSLNNLSAMLPGHLSSCVANNSSSSNSTVLSNSLYDGLSSNSLLTNLPNTVFSSAAVNLASDSLNKASNSMSTFSIGLPASGTLPNGLSSHLSMPMTSFQPTSIAANVGGNIFYPGPFGPPTPRGGDICPEALADAAEPNQYLCAICGREFRFEKNMLRHMQKAHAVGDDESVLKCKLCNYTTKHYSNMYVHIRTHTGDKPYWCSACGASFTQGSSLKLHIKSRHDDDMSYFSLNKKLGKNNLTKLWQRVLKKDLKNFCMMESLDVKPHMMLSSNINSLLGSYSAAASAFGHPHPLFALLGQHSPFAFGASNRSAFPSSASPSSSAVVDVKPLSNSAQAMVPLNLKLKSEPDLQADQPDPTQVTTTASWPSLGAAPPQPISSSLSSSSYTQHEGLAGALACTADERNYLAAAAAQKVFPLNLSAESLHSAWSQSTAHSATVELNMNRLHHNSNLHSHMMQALNAPKTTASTSLPVSANVSLDQLQAKANDLHNFMKFNITSGQFAGHEAKSLTSTLQQYNPLSLRADKCFQTDTMQMPPELAAGNHLSYENAVLREQLKRLRRNAKSLLSTIFPMDLNIKDEMEVDECLEKAMRLTHRDS